MFLPKAVTPDLMFSVREGTREEKQPRSTPICTSSLIKVIIIPHAFKRLKGMTICIKGNFHGDSL